MVESDSTMFFDLHNDRYEKPRSDILGCRLAPNSQYVSRKSLKLFYYFIIITSPLERRPASLRLLPTVIASEFHVKFEFIVLLRRTSAGTIAEVTLKIAGHSF